MISQTRAIALRLYKFYIFSFISTLLFFFVYLYFISASIYYTSVLKDSQLKISNINSEISELEAGFVKSYESVTSSEFSKKFVTIHEESRQFAKAEKYLGRAD